jgi:hypothetical protein
MEEAPENGKESPHSAHTNGLIDLMENVKQFYLQMILVTYLPILVSEILKIEFEF